MASGTKAVERPWTYIWAPRELQTRIIHHLLTLIITLATRRLSPTNTSATMRFTCAVALATAYYASAVQSSVLYWQKTGCTHSAGTYQACSLSGNRVCQSVTYFLGSASNHQIRSSAKATTEPRQLNTAVPTVGSTQSLATRFAIHTRRLRDPKTSKPQSPSKQDVFPMILRRQTPIPIAWELYGRVMDGGPRAGIGRWLIFPLAALYDNCCHSLASFVTHRDIDDCQPSFYNHVRYVSNLYTRSCSIRVLLFPSRRSLLYVSDVYSSRRETITSYH
jgi:hypothetical protein